MQYNCNKLIDNFGNEKLIYGKRFIYRAKN